MVKLIFTRFPVTTETFLQREVIALKELGMDFEIESLLGESTKNEIYPCRVYPLIGGIFRLLYRLPFWMILKPKALTKIINAHLEHRPPNLINFAEGLLGLCFGISEARRFQREGVDHMHGVWASSPTTASWVISELTGIRFSFGAHAYDLFEGGGDWTLSDKIRNAEFIRTSTDKGKFELLRKGAWKAKVHVIRRGLNELPPFYPKDKLSTPLRILSVGRLVEKMGYFEQIAIYDDLQRMGIDFEARILGGGPLREQIEQRLIDLGLADRVRLKGEVPYSEVEKSFEWCDLFLFTGIISKSGDQAGLPNAVAEAMAWGRPVFAFSVGAVEEVVTPGVSGWIVDGGNAASHIRNLFDTELQMHHGVVTEARRWVEANYVASTNMSLFMKLIIAVPS